jgi:general stress protein YciG
MTEQKKKKGVSFAAMDPAKQREIARKGGIAAHEKGTAPELVLSGMKGESKTTPP